MKRNARIAWLLLALLLLLLPSCGSYQGTTGGNNDKNPSQGGSSDPLQGEEGLTFSVRILYEGAYITPHDLVEEGETAEVKAIWSDGFSYQEATFDETGTAKLTGLDGDYRVTLSGLPEGYAYDPNAYRVTNDNRDATVEIFKHKTTRKSGADLYTNCIKISSIGLYCAELDDEDDIVYYEFTPKESGTYTVVSWVDTAANTVNPMVDVYNGTSAFKLFAYTQDDGGASSTFTKNFVHEVKISMEEVGNCFTFGVRAAVTTGNTEELRIYFAIQLNGGMYSNAYVKEMMIPVELLEHVYDEIRMLQALSLDEYRAFFGYGEYSQDWTKDAHAALQAIRIPTYNELTGTYSHDHADLHHILYGREGGEMDLLRDVRGHLEGLFANNGTYVYAESDRLGAEGRLLFDQDMYRLCPDDGFYHLYDEAAYPETNGYGPILYADLTTGGRFLEASLATMEYAGNSALTVWGTHNYKHFIEGYASLITPRGGYPNITPAYYCSYMGDDERITTNCPCLKDCGGGCPEGCETCTDSCRPCPISLKFAPGYADFANRDGRVPVTQELKDFLQGFSISQRYFADGNGWVETHDVYAVDAPEDSQWLWACGYYK